MKKSLTVLVAIVSLTLTCHLSLSAQDGKVANKVFYSELFGPGVIMSANFDSRFSSNDRLGFGYRLGVGFAIENMWKIYSDRQTYCTVPAGLNYVFGKANSSNTFEAGAGVTILTRKVSISDFYGHNEPGNAIGFLTFMYRMMLVDGGFSFRAGLTPIIGTCWGKPYLIGAFGVGYAF